MYSFQSCLVEKPFIAMDVEKVFHMNGGIGETSYHENSSLQKNAAERIQDIALEAMEETYSALRPRSLGIADLGCSSGSNALRYVKMAVAAVISRDAAPLPEFRVCLNDLPSNDFNTVFAALPDFFQELKKGRKDPSVLVAAYPGSFYGRLFPRNSLHLLFSFSSLHWLSRIPPGIYDERGVSMNKKSITLVREYWMNYLMNMPNYWK
ncbi:probable methyltransferase TCM_000336 [Salvia miltiorrhiza]|uniref:probable methyltransferase TCM_000336 n=1 Tax=Salvia miltiorrhiza TaxID=226208 RepID=UPI0025AD0807|nr:probable methyltransferase TCM_000336 [Salvia miltiorrhiza]